MLRRQTRRNWRRKHHWVWVIAGYAPAIWCDWHALHHVPRTREFRPGARARTSALASGAHRDGLGWQVAPLGGCAGSPKPTCLSLQFGEIQGDFAKLQGERRLIPAECPRISMGWIGLSLIQGAGRPSFHSREGRFRNTAPVFFGDIHAAQFNVRFWVPFGHRRMAHRCRLLTQSGHSFFGALGAQAGACAIRG
jgi:hypothetical protein